MALYEVTETGLERRAIARFATLEIYERQDLQRLLRDQVMALGEDLPRVVRHAASERKPRSRQLFRSGGGRESNPPGGDRPPHRF